MTKLVRLTNKYLNFAKSQNLKGVAGNFYVEIEFLAPVPSEDVAYDSNEIKNNMNQITFYNLKLDALGRKTVDFNSIHSVIPINCYCFENKDSVVEIPDYIFDKLKDHTVEEVAP